MRAKLYANLLRLGGSAWEYIRQVQNSRPISVKEIGEPGKAEALELLESFRDSNRPPDEIDLGVITGADVSRRLDYDLRDFKVIPYPFSDAARSNGDGVLEGSYVTLIGDDRVFEVVRVSWEQESVRIRSDDNKEFTVPWGLLQRSG